MFVSFSVSFSIALCFSKYRSFTSLLLFRLVIAMYIYGYIYMCVCFNLLISLFQIHFNNPDFYFPSSMITILVNIYYIFCFMCQCCCCCWVTSVVSDSVWPRRGQPTRLPSPWDSPGKNTGVGCHVLLQCMKVKSESEVAQLCPTLSDPMDCSLPGSSVHGIFQAGILEWGAIAFSIYVSLKYLLDMQMILSL